MGLKPTLSELDDILRKVMGIFKFTSTTDEPLDETLLVSVCGFSNSSFWLYFLQAYYGAVSIVF